MVGNSLTDPRVIRIYQPFWIIRYGDLMMNQWKPVFKQNRKRYLDHFYPKTIG